MSRQHDQPEILRQFGKPEIPGSTVRCTLRLQMCPISKVSCISCNGKCYLLLSITQERGPAIPWVCWGGERELNMPPSVLHTGYQAGEVCLTAEAQGKSPEQSEGVKDWMW